MKKIAALILVLVILLSFTAAVPRSTMGFVDVPKGHFFEEYINKLQELNITNGIGKGAFGFNKEITRAEFLTFLVRLQGQALDSTPNNEMFKDIKNDWFYPYANMGIKNKIVVKSDYADGNFYPGKPITREEMAVMIVRALNYDTLAFSLNSQGTQFTDVKQRIGYIQLAKDLGIINGRSGTIFDPTAKATKQEAAAMLIRMYNNNNHKLDTLNAFYAIDSYKQVDKVSSFDSISYGWSRLDYNETSGMVEMTTAKKTGGHPFYVPADFQLAVNGADANGVAKYLMIFGSNEDKVTVNGAAVGIVSQLLSSDASMQKLISNIIETVSNPNSPYYSAQFDGVVVDFEALRDNGTDKQNFIKLLTALDDQLEQNNKKLVVAINPPAEAGRQYYNGYDFASIGQLSDYVILMAHDYDTKQIKDFEMPLFKGETPLAPIKEIYTALKNVMNGGAGVPKEKLLLQISFSTAQWQFKDGAVINKSPYTPDYGKVISRMKDANTAVKAMNFADLYKSPYFSFETEGIRNTIWYEDERSVNAKIQMAKMFGIKGLSFWRLGTIPDYAGTENDAYNLDIWSVISELNK